MRRPYLAGLAVVFVVAVVGFSVFRTHAPASRVDLVAPSTTGPAETISPTSTTASGLPPFDDGVYPFATTADATAYLASGSHLYDEPVAVTLAFARVFVGMPHPVLGPFGRTSGDRGTVTVRPSASAGAATVVSLRELFPGGPWTVVGAAADEIVLDRPAAGATISSPATLSGRSTAFEATVSVEVRHLSGPVAGDTIGAGIVMGGANGTMGPFHGSVSFHRATPGAGALLLTEKSAEDGSPIDATVVRVRLTGN